MPPRARRESEPERGAPEGETKRRRPSRLRWIALAVALGLLVLRAALPLALRPVLASQAGDALGATVRVGDVDLWLLRGAVALRDVAVLPPGAEAAHAAPAEPLLAWKRLYADLDWLALLGRRIELATVLLEAPSLSMALRADGTLDAAALLAPREEAAGEASSASAESSAGSVGSAETAASAGPDGSPEDGGGWPLAARALRIDDLRVSLRDERGEAPSLHTLRLGALALEDARWDAAGGALGSLALRDLRVGVRGAAAAEDETVAAEPPEDAAPDEPPLAWRSLALEGLRLDPAGESVSLASVVLDGGALLLSPHEPWPLPALPPPPGRSGGQAEDAPAEDAAERGAGWSWEIERLAIEETRLRIAGRDLALGFDTALEMRRLASSAGEPGHLDLKVEDVAGGTLALAGRFRIAPLSCRGAIRWEALSLPRLTSAVPLEAAHLLRSGESSGELSLALGPPLPEEAEAADAGGDPGGPASPAAQREGDALRAAGEEDALRAAGEEDALRAAGEVRIADLRVAAADADDFDVGWRALSVGIEELVVPLADDAPGGAAPVRLALSSLELEAPSVRLVRTADGLLLPLGQKGEAEAPAASEGAAAEAPAASEGAAAEAPGFELALAALRVDGARVALVDRSLEPALEATLQSVEASASGVRWPALRADELALGGRALETGTWKLTGGLSPEQGRLALEVDMLPLVPLDPAARRALGYHLARGEASLDSRVTIEGRRYESRNRLVIHDPGLSRVPGEHSFVDQLGIPLSLAIALLRDPAGNVSLDLPVDGDAGQVRSQLGATLLGVLRQTLVGAVSSPLKLIGSVALQGGRIQAFVPEPVVFAPGSDDLEPEGREQLAKLGELLSRRPGLGLELEGAVTAEDERALRERALLARLREGERPPGVGRGAARRLRAHLEARLEGTGDVAAASPNGGEPEPDGLEPADRELLAALLEASAPGAEALRDLAARRETAVASWLREERDVADAQLRIPEARAGDSGAPAAGRPRVEIQLTTASS